MHTFVRSRVSIAAALVASAGLVVAGTLFTSSSASRPKAPVNAATLNGYHAKDLVKTLYTRNPNSLDNFDTANCAFVTRLTQAVVAPVPGYISVTGAAAGARDTDHADPSELVIRLRVGKTSISGEVATQLTTDGSYDGNVSVLGFKKVPAGKTVVQLQLSECGDGADSVAFVTDRSISTVFTPFGKGDVKPALKTASRSHN
jgi:hypothetical protein